MSLQFIFKLNICTFQDPIHPRNQILKKFVKTAKKKKIYSKINSLYKFHQFISKSYSRFDKILILSV
jgi:hypothetical protein